MEFAYGHNKRLREAGQRAKVALRSWMKCGFLMSRFIHLSDHTFVVILPGQSLFVG